MKVFYFDTETTGLNSKVNDIIQLGFIIEIDGKVVRKEKLEMQPFDYSSISKIALDTHKISVEKMKTFDTPQIAYAKIVNILDEYINKYDKEDKFIPAGYNVKFDMEFLREFFIKNNNKYFGSYFDYHFIDAMAILFLKRYAGKIALDNYKLETACNYYNIEIKSHDALSDISATRELLLKVMKEIEWSQTKEKS